MAHFAKIGVGNIVEQVVVVSNDVATSEQAGVEFLQNLYKDRAVWKQTSFNTFAGKHWTFTKDENDKDIKVESSDQSKALRKNFAGIGFTYDSVNDVFIAPKPFNSWTLDTTTFKWIPPVARPDDFESNSYYWNEDNQTWDLLT